MTIEPFLRPKLVGKRFEETTIPLEFLRDFAVLEEMIVEVAKWRFREEHPDRKRSPRGFTDRITLALADIEEGSAIANIVLSLRIGASTLFPLSDDRIYYEQARDCVTAAIEAAAEGKPATNHLPREALAFFDRFGRSLRDEEAIEFPFADKPPVRLTRDVRRKLLADSGANVLTDSIELRGAVHEADQNAMTFQMMLADGSKIPGPIAPQHFDTIMQAFAEYLQGAKILIQGVGEFSRGERLQSILSIEHTMMLDPLDILARIQELKLLKHGWLDANGLAPPEAGLDWLATALRDRYPDTLALPCIYPTAAGGVQLEWSFDPEEISLEIDLAEQSGEWHSLNLQTGKEETESLTLVKEQNWVSLIDRLTKIAGVAP
jgi:hypothetical protein